MARRSVSRTEGLLRMLQSRGVQRGFWGTSRGWLWVAVGAFGLRQVRKAIGSEPKLACMTFLRDFPIVPSSRIAYNILLHMREDIRLSPH